MNPWIEVAGRFHPVILHTPIGLLAGLAALELVLLFAKGEGWLGAVRVLSFLAAGSAVAAAVTGYILSLEGGGKDYAGDTITWHFYLGIAVAVACSLLFIASIAGGAWARRGLLAVALGLLFPAAHLGGTVTHGENFLFAPLSRGEAKPQKPAEPRTQFGLVIEPILADKCVQCHGENKSKGGLRLDSAKAIMEGGDSGRPVEPGNPAVSLLVKRMHLPLDDDEHMPPKKKPQPTPEEIAAIEAWIAAGASFDAPPAEGGAAPAGGEKPKDERQSAAPAKPAIAAPPAAAVAALRGMLAHAEPVSADNPRLIVTFSAIAPTVDDAAAARVLAPLAEYIEDLTLARTKTGDATLALAAKMPHLRRLDVGSTLVTPAGLAALKDNKTLEELVLSRSPLAGGDEEVAAAAGSMPRLSSMYLWESGVLPETVAKLRQALPKLHIDAGDLATTEKLEGETEVKFTSDAPVVGAAPAGAAPTAEQIAAALKPINTVCPVSGSPIKPEYQVLYKGKVIGFCCPNCPKTFWENPEACLAKIEADNKK